jgi:HK97 family phage prohead protease
MQTTRKSYPLAEFKALPDGDGKTGQVEALVSVFDNVDIQGDRVIRNAFTKSIQKWKASGDMPPVIFSHDWGDIWSHIGVVTHMEETPKGLLVRYQLDVEDNPVAAQAYRLMKRRTLKEHSFAYEILKERTAKDGANELLELDIIEIGPTLKGANPATELVGVKAAIEAAAKETKSPPWHIEEDNPDCAGYAVVVDESDEVVGCHDTRDAAEAHIAALYANVEDASSSKSIGKIYVDIVPRFDMSKLHELAKTLNDFLASTEAQGAVENGKSTESATKTEEPVGAKAEESRAEELLQFKAAIEDLETGL